VLRHLSVENFALLSTVSIDFGPGMNVLTGETGAGKSLIIEAVNLLRGGRASADIPRTGSEEAVVEAIFEVPADLQGPVCAVLEQSGLPLEADGAEVLVRRVIHRGGRSRTYVNGAMTTATCLAEVGRMLVDLSGQHQHQDLSDAKRHRAILDQYGGHQTLCAEVAAAVDSFRQKTEELESLTGDPTMRAQRIDYMRFQLAELDSADLQPGELETLEQDRVRLRASDKLQRAAAEALELVYSEDGAALERIDAALAKLSAVQGTDERLAEPARLLLDARALIDETATQLRQYGDSLGDDPGRLEEIEERVALIKKLERKHALPFDALLVRHQELAKELALLEDQDGAVARLEAEIAAEQKRASELATRLSQARKKAAKTLVKDVGTVLSDLSMGSAALDCVIDEAELTRDGADRVEFMLRANKGEAAKPLHKVASGGELSRIMLALKLVLRRADGVATYVLDEVDAGIGGATADVVGQKIRALSQSRQVLCVTHLAQIAAAADSQYRVEKHEVKGRTETAVKKLSAADRKEEIARMLGGKAQSKRARAHASELLETARG
jgi:DNA repair protein RecN (Recombination protein N)